MSTQIDELAKTLDSILALYSEEITEGIKEETRKVAKEAQRRLKLASKKATNGKTEYANSWSVYIKKNNANELKTVIRNVKHYQLTHLLEKGTNTRQTNKGLNRGAMPEREHIKPVADWAQEEYEKRVKHVIENTK